MTHKKIVTEEYKMNYKNIDTSSVKTELDFEQIQSDLAKFKSHTSMPQDDVITLMNYIDKFERLIADKDYNELEYRPDYINDEILTMLKSYGMKVIELGVQSANDEVLKKSNRGHTFDDVIKASQLIKEYGIYLGLQMMTGLPGDTKQTSVETAQKIASLNPDCVRIYPTLVMENTALYKMYKSNEYIPWTVDEAVDVVSKIIPIFENNGIDIIRIGLQTTDNVNQNTVIGPYHPAFAELCYSRIERNKIENIIIVNNIKDTVYEINAPKQLFSKITGHKKENILYFKNKYNVDIILKEKLYD